MGEEAGAPSPVLTPRDHSKPCGSKVRPVRTSKGVNGFNIYLLQGSNSKTTTGKKKNSANGCVFAIKTKSLMHLIIRGQFANH